MKVLNKKLLRGIWRSRGQAVAVAVIVLCGAASYICMASAHRNLLLTRDTYYSQYRFADFEIHLERAPLRSVFKLENLPGVRQARGRIVKDVNVDIEGVDEPRIGRLISMPGRREPVLNDVCLAAGRYFDEGVQNEVILSERFAEANGLRIGDRIQVSVGNKKHSLRIVGLGLSPEYVYMIRSVQDIIPNMAVFGILWVPQDFAETALAMEAACNNIVGTVHSPDAIDQILDDAEKVLEPYGVFAKTTRDDQISSRFLADEIKGLEVSARVVPGVFLGIASMVILVLLNRMVRKERTEIGLLKAYGHTNATVAWHYLKYALLLAIAGCVGAFFVGQWLAKGMIGMYVEFYQFPLLQARVYPDVLMRSMGMAGAAALLGALMAARRAVRIAPAESMRPETPRYAHRIWLEQFTVLWRNLTFTWKMIARNISRNKFRAGLNVFGVAVSMGLLIMGFFSTDALNFMLRFQFREAQREDVKVSFPIERGKDAYYEVRRFDHVRRAEPVLQYPFEIRSGWRKKDTVVIGLPQGAQLQKLLDDKHREVDIGEKGLVLSRRLAQNLGVGPGGYVTLKPLMGRIKKEKRVRVSKIVRQYLGSSAYMNVDALSRVLDESFAMNAALLRVEPGKEHDLNVSLKDVPGISAVEIKKDSYRALMDTLARNMKVMNTTLILFAGVIACAVIYNLTTVALAERQRELASLRVMGFTTAEVGGIMYYENFLLAFFGLILGIPFGMGICLVLVKLYDTELYRLPYHIEQRTFIISTVLSIIFVALANFAVHHKIKTLDMVEVLKARE